MERIKKGDPDFYVAIAQMISNCRIRVLIINVGGGIDRDQFKKQSKDITIRVFKDEALWGKYLLSEIDPKMELSRQGGRHDWVWDPLDDPRFREIESGAFTLKVVLENHSKIKETSFKNNVRTSEVQCTSFHDSTPCGILLDSLSVKKARTRDIIYLSGQFGTEQGEKIVVLKEIRKENEELKIYKMKILKWTNTRIHVIIPDGLLFGQYKIGILCDTISPFHSGWETIWINP